MFETDEMIIFGLIGETGVGKSHLIHRYIKNSLPQRLTSTIAVQFSTGFYKLEDNTKLKLKLWDTSGQQKYKQMVCYHLKQAHAVVIVYDVTDQKSFEKIDEWLGKLQKQQIQPLVLILLGNKSDMNQTRVISYKEGEQKAKQISAQFYETNSFDYEQVTQIFNQIVQIIIQKRAQKQIKLKQQQLVKFNKDRRNMMPQSIEGSGVADAVCSGCEMF